MGTTLEQQLASARRRKTRAMETLYASMQREWELLDAIQELPPAPERTRAEIDWEQVDRDRPELQYTQKQLHGLHKAIGKFRNGFYAHFARKHIPPVTDAREIQRRLKLPMSKQGIEEYLVGPPKKERTPRARKERQAAPLLDIETVDQLSHGQRAAIAQLIKRYDPAHIQERTGIPAHISLAYLHQKNLPPPVTTAKRPRQDKTPYQEHAASLSRGERISIAYLFAGTGGRFGPGVPHTIEEIASKKKLDIRAVAGVLLEQGKIHYDEELEQRIAAYERPSPRATNPRERKHTKHIAPKEKEPLSIDDVTELTHGQRITIGKLAHAGYAPDEIQRRTGIPAGITIGYLTEQHRRETYYRTDSKKTTPVLTRGSSTKQRRTYGGDLIRHPTRARAPIAAQHQQPARPALSPAYWRLRADDLVRHNGHKDPAHIYDTLSRAGMTLPREEMLPYIVQAQERQRASAAQPPPASSSSSINIPPPQARTITPETRVRIPEEYRRHWYDMFGTSLPHELARLTGMDAGQWKNVLRGAETVTVNYLKIAYAGLGLQRQDMPPAIRHLFPADAVPRPRGR